MSSNIVFESNVYPVVRSIAEDEEFLSKIWDYNRLHAISSKNFNCVPLSSLQRQIIQEKPTCALNKEDPCWGMIKSGTTYRWISMCTKTECPHFALCRSEIPFDPEKERSFIPTGNSLDEYGYEHFLSEYSPAPVLVGDDTDYEIVAAKTSKKRTNRVTETDVSLFQKLIRSDNAPKMPLEEQPSDEFERTDKPAEPVLTDSNNGNATDTAQEEDCPEKEVDIFSSSLNVFDHFKECSQTEIITASSKENFFVDAGPGTGKTYTLIQKINHMVTAEGVEADGILVLCFTNAAVDEIKSRLRQFVDNGADRSLVNVDIRTFHSFAWWLINQANTVLTDRGWHPINLHGLSYEMSLIKASEIISRFGKDVVENWEYFVVDEVQDLTNSLGHFVLKLVNACLFEDCGVTVLGDACQAIYDYDQETRGAVLKSGEFYKALFRQMYGKSRFVYLSENHRQGAELIQLTAGLRTAILSDETKRMAEAVLGFDNAVEKVTLEGTTINSTFLDKLRNGGSVSLLFRNNGQTLKMSSDLRKRGISHTLNVSETKNNFAPWIVDVFGSYKKSTISEDAFLDLYEESTGKNGSGVWTRLQRLLHTDNDVLSVRALIDAVAVSKIDDPLLRTVRTQNVVVSNIHRSKGREYDCVVVDQSFVDTFSQDTDADEFKTLYVAITRPKKRLILAPLQSKSGMKVIHIFASGRRRWGKPKNKKIAYLELDASKDINTDVFAHTLPACFEEVQMGDSVYLKRSIKNGKLSYSIIHEDTERIMGVINETSPYVQDFISYMKIDGSSYVELPATINDLYVSGIYSQVADSQYLDLHPEIKEAAPNGVWKWIELVGIGHADYDVY